MANEIVPRQDSALGPQCLRCRRRRVKCDSASGACQRCGRDGFDCPGYEKKTKWKVVTPHAMERYKRRKTVPTLRRGSSEPSSTTPTDSSEPSSPSSVSNSSVGGSMPTSLILSTIEREILEIQSSIIYYNDTLVPDLAASPILSEPMHIPIDIWLEKSPKVLHHIIVTIVMTHRLAVNGSAHGVANGKDETQLADTLNRHRGRGLMHLQRILSEFWHGDGNPATTEAQRKTKGLVTLIAVVMLLTQEVQMSATSLWSMHLEAARSLVVQQGGIQNLWSRSPFRQGLFTLYMMIDMLSPPTSPAWSISESQQREYLETIGKLEHFERMIIASFQPCPLPVLTAVVQTNVLRAQIHRHEMNLTDPETFPSAAEDAITISQSIALNMASLLRFDPATWSKKVCIEYLNLPLPRRPDDAYDAAWKALATAYQSAAIIYLLRSVQQTVFATSIGEDIEGMLHEQRMKLSGSLSFLCRDLSRAKANSLWRFVSFALFIYTYELVGWTPLPFADTSPASAHESEDALIFSIPQHQLPKNVIAAFRRLQRIARRLGANCLFDAVELLQGVWRRRCASAAYSAADCDEVGVHAGWKWDDGFEGRCVFVV